MLQKCVELSHINEWSTLEVIYDKISSLTHFQVCCGESTDRRVCGRRRYDNLQVRNIFPYFLEDSTRIFLLQTLVSVGAFSSHSPDDKICYSFSCFLYILVAVHCDVELRDSMKRFIIFFFFSTFFFFLQLFFFFFCFSLNANFSRFFLFNALIKLFLPRIGVLCSFDFLLSLNMNFHDCTFFSH